MSELAGVATAGLVKVGAGAVRSGVVAILRNPFARWRACVTVSKIAEERGWPVSWRGLWKWLGRSDTGELLRTGSPAAIASSLRSLEFILPGPRSETKSRFSEELLQEMMIALIRRYNPSEATALASTRTSFALNDVKSKLQSDIEAAGDQVIEAINAPRQFEVDLETFQEMRRDVLVQAGEEWPRFRYLLRELAMLENRGPALRQWAERWPRDLAAAPISVFLALSLLSSDYGESGSHEAFLDEAIARGAYPREYWLARLAVSNIGRHKWLVAGGDAHPLGKVLVAADKDDRLDAINLLDDWQTASDEDAAIKCMLQATLQAGVNLNAAIGILDSYQGPSTGVPLLLAKLLLSRARHGESTLPINDALEALKVALSVRDARRKWKGNSAEAALVAVQAAVLSNDYTRGWRLTRLPPEGEANLSEANSDVLRHEALMMAVQMSNTEVVREIAAGSADDFERNLLAVVEHRDRGEQQAELDALLGALNGAHSDPQRISLAFMLAHAGGTVPELSDLEQEYAEAIADLREISEVVRGIAGGDIATLRARATNSRSLTMLLAERLNQQEQYKDAGNVMRSGAERWNDAHLMRMAAASYLKATEYSEAQSAAEDALSFGGPGWPGAYDARVILLKAHEAQGHAEAVTNEARQLVVLSPESQDARWALIACQLRAGDASGAWATLTPDGIPISPRDRQDVRGWIGLISRFDHSRKYFSRAFGELANWKDDEEMSGIIIANMMARKSVPADELTDAEVKEFHEATSAYVEQFPDSSILQAIRIDESQPLESIREVLREQHESQAELASLLKQEKIPLALWSLLSGLPYAQALVQRAGGSVRTHRRAMGPAPTSEPLSQTVVVMDTSAAATLALFDSELTDLLWGQFAGIETTDLAYRDALNGQQNLGLRSTLTVYWDDATDGPRVSSHKVETVDRLASRANRVVEIVSRARLKSWSKVISIDWKSERDDWLSCIDLAHSNNRILWCDDLLLRDFCDNVGVESFGTVQLLYLLEDAGVLSTARREAAQAVLITNCYIDLQWSRPAMELALSLEGGAPKGAAFAVSQASSWENAEVMAELLLETLEKVSTVDPEWLRDWINAGALGLMRVAGDPEMAERNLSIFLQRVAAQSWLNASTLPWVLRGVRAAVMEESPASDPIAHVMHSWLEEASTKVGAALGAQYLMGLFGQADEEDRRLLARTIILGSRQ